MTRLKTISDKLDYISTGKLNKEQMEYICEIDQEVNKKDKEIERLNNIIEEKERLNNVIDKAIEYIIENSEMYDEDLCTSVEFELRDLLNILNGGDE